MLPPLLTNAIRFLVGGVLFFLFTLLRGYGFPTLKQWLSAAWVGVLLSGIGNCVWWLMPLALCPQAWWRCW
ncbi:MAG: hypothetical protein R2822_14300 [Spirosomataceae bacterium]